MSDAQLLVLADELRGLWEQIADIDALIDAEPSRARTTRLRRQAKALTERAEALGFALAALPAASPAGLFAKFAAAHDGAELAAWLDPAFAADAAEEAIRASLARDPRRMAEAAGG